VIGALDISRSALVAQRVRMDVIAGNIANAFTTEQPDGRLEPYRRRVVTFGAGDEFGGPGVHVGEVNQDPSEFRLQYDPGHAHAIPDGPLAGYVRYPNVNITMEYIDALAASRAYEVNLAMVNVTKGMIEQAIQLMA
jgi:flagellar basal-body rod protein FlgC